MATSRHIRTLSRRTVLKLAGGLAGGLATAGAWMSVSTAAPLFTGVRYVYYFDPNCATDSWFCRHPSRIGGSCNVCTACINHAANKRWSVFWAMRRAHPCCRCTVKRMKVSKAEFGRMFGTGFRFRYEYDARR